MRAALPEDVQKMVQLWPGRAEDLVPGESTLDSAVVLLNNRIVAYGLMRLSVEVVIATDPSFTSFQRATAIQRLLGLALEVARHRPIDELIAFTDDTRYAKFLQRLGFLDVKEQTLALKLR